MIGNNFRMGELEAAISIVQLNKLKKIIFKRVKIANYLTDKLSEIDGLILPRKYNDNTNVYYTYPIVLKKQKNLIEKKF